MTHYVCVVEYRNRETGVMHHYTRELNAPDGEAAGVAAERSFLEEHSGAPEAVEIAEVVCHPEGNH